MFVYIDVNIYVPAPSAERLWPLHFWGPYLAPSIAMPHPTYIHACVLIYMCICIVGVCVCVCVCVRVCIINV